MLKNGGMGSGGCVVVVGELRSSKTEGKGECQDPSPIKHTKRHEELSESDLQSSCRRDVLKPIWRTGVDILVHLEVAENFLWLLSACDST